MAKLDPVFCGALTGDELLDLARAAIASLREPTPKMVASAYESVERDDQWRIEDAADFSKAWASSIDAALSEPGSGEGG